MISFVRYLNFSDWLFGHAEKWCDQKDKANLKIYDVASWLRNKCNTNIAQHLEK